MSKTKADLLRKLYRLRVKRDRLDREISAVLRRLRAKEPGNDGSRAGPNGWPASYWKRKRR